MIKKIIAVSFLGMTIFLMGFLFHDEVEQFNEEKPVREILAALESYEAPNHLVDPSVKHASIEKGKEIVHRGFTKGKSGFKTRRISKHFVCTSCHNIEREAPNLAKIDPQARLEYTNEKGLPFLQGSPLYGIVNRHSFYNDDYFKKYGDLVFAARNDLREAIQLCSTECSQGRLMKKWELESVLMYLWTLELRMNDLQFTPEEKNQIQKAINEKTQQSETAEMIKSKFLDNSPAHFIAPPSTREERNAVNGNAENGALIYTNSCMYCHEKRRYSFFNLDFSKGTFRNLRNNLDHYHERSIYQVARYGTSPAAGKRAYMPQYTEEKMSRQQLEDLKAYIVREAK